MVDAGDLMWKSKKVAEGRLGQQRVKGRLQLEAYVHSGVDAMLLGEADLALGPAWIGQQAAELNVPYVATNFSCEDVAMPTHRTVQVGEHTVAVFGVIGRKLAEPCTFRAVVPALKSAIEAAGAVDLVVVLSHQDASADAAMAVAVPAIDLVINGHSKKSTDLPEQIGLRALHLGSGGRGKRVGVAELSLKSGAEGFEVEGAEEDAQQRLKKARARIAKTEAKLKDASDPEARERAQSRLDRLREQEAVAHAEAEAAKADVQAPRHRVRHALRPLSDKVDDHTAVMAMVTAAKPLIASAAAQSAPPVRRPSDDPIGPYVGSQACAACHAEQHAQWMATAHAYAWSTLQKVGREQDLDCWSCHVTGAHDSEGPQHPSQVKGLENVGCESCHGPGEAHVAAPSSSTIRKVPSVEGCTTCHDGVKDEGRFDHAKYLERVDH